MCVPFARGRKLPEQQVPAETWRWTGGMLLNDAGAGFPSMAFLPMANFPIVQPLAPLAGVRGSAF